MSSTYSACSAFRCSVASDTDLSRLSMPAISALISLAIVATDSSSVAIWLSSPLIENSRLFFLSSAPSNWDSQYSFLWSSSSCSSVRSFTISSIIFTTLSKFTFLPCSANAMKSSCDLWPGEWRHASVIMANACSRCFALLTVTWTKELAPGSVFLNISSASSSLRILIVSASATCSSARIFMFASYSSFFVPQFASRSAKNLESSAKAFCVSLRSCFICTISTPNSPTRTVFVSIAPVRLLISFVFAAINASYALIAAASAASASASPLAIVSFISFKMPVISPLFGAYPSFSVPERKDKSSSRSYSASVVTSSTMLRKN
mmetsp:Transcript_44451/g.73914  ORF Transcript_44451/g.73914 Transcript_44451/m.73914 type:complete len:321 (+) Transcript_44451:703-1665(+)